MPRTPEQAREHALACIWPRWKGDPYPEAAAAEREACQRQSNAWQAVADEAQHEANAADAVRVRFTNGRKIPGLVAAALAVAESVTAAQYAALRAEQARPPRTPDG
jgi:hypothetical protein